MYLPGGGGYLIASSQAGSNTLNSYLVYDRLGSNAFIREFRVVDGPQTDGCGWTDGIDALATNLGPSFPHGIFICQDNANSMPGTVGNQNFKFVPLERVVGLGLVDPPPPPGTVLMVVANPSSLIAGEVAVRNRLTNGGFSVAVIDDNLVSAADANGTAFVFVSSTADANTLRARLRDVPQPVWMAKPYLLDDMLMTGPVADVDYGNVSTASVAITNAAHPLAAGLSGTVTVTTANHTKSFGVPGPAADVVATANGRATTFVYQAGDPLVGGTTAAGCRLTSSAFQNGPASFTAAGWTLFDAAADYAASNCGSGAPLDDPPSIDLTTPADGATVNGVVALSADASDAEGIQQVEFFVRGSSVGVDSAGGDGWGLAWDSSTTTDGAATCACDGDRHRRPDGFGSGRRHDRQPRPDGRPHGAGRRRHRVGPFVNVTATASDAVGLAQVEFLVDGTSIGVDTTGGNGWSVQWDTTTHAGGAASVSATATDTAGRTAPGPVSVTVDNSSPGTVRDGRGQPELPDRR